MRAALYLRVSTDDQTTENQERELRATADRAGHEIMAVYRDKGISGAKGRDKRPDRFPPPPEYVSDIDERTAISTIAQLGSRQQSN